MPLDPTLALNPGRVDQPDIMAAIKSGLEARNLALQPEVTQAKIRQYNAETTGIEATSAQKQRELAAQKWFGENSDSFLVPSTNGGPPIYDAANAMKAATKAGYGDLVPHIAKDYSDFMSGQIKSSTDAQSLNQTRFNASISGPAVAAQMVKSVPENKKVQMYQASRQHLQSIFGDTISGNMMPDLATPKDVDAWSDATTSAASTYMEKLKAQNEQSNTGATAQGAETSRAVQSQNAATQDVASTQASNSAKILADGIGIPSNMDTGGKRRAAVTEYNRLHGTDFTVFSPGLDGMLKQAAGRQETLSSTFTKAAAAGKPQTVSPPSMQVAPGTQVARDTDRMRLVEQELAMNPGNAQVQEEYDRLVAKGVKSTRQSENKSTTKTVPIFNPKTGKMMQVDPEHVEAVKRVIAKMKPINANSKQAMSIEEELGRGR